MQADLHLCCSHIAKAGFVVMWLKFNLVILCFSLQFRKPINVTTLFFFFLISASPKVWRDLVQIPCHSFSDPSIKSLDWADFKRDLGTQTTDTKVCWNGWHVTILNPQWPRNFQSNDWSVKPNVNKTVIYPSKRILSQSIQHSEGFVILVNGQLSVAWTCNPVWTLP